MITGKIKRIVESQIEDISKEKLPNYFHLLMV